MAAGRGQRFACRRFSQILSWADGNRLGRLGGEWCRPEGTAWRMVPAVPPFSALNSQALHSGLDRRGLGGSAPAGSCDILRTRHSESRSETVSFVADLLDISPAARRRQRRPTLIPSDRLWSAWEPKPHRRLDGGENRHPSNSIRIPEFSRQEAWPVLGRS